MSLPNDFAAAIDAVHQATAIYTADPVVDGLLDRVGWPYEGATLLDPSAGDGAFVRRALARLELAVDDIDEALRVRGYEMHAGAVQQARHLVATDLSARGWTPAIAADAAAQMILQGDFLLDRIEGTYSLIVGNPPYLRFSKLPDVFKDLYGPRLNAWAAGDLLHAFLDRCVALLPPDGLIALVTADRWLGNETAGRLRASIGERVGLHYVRRLECESSFYRAKTRRSGTLPRVHPVEVILGPVESSRQRITAAPISPDGESEPYTGPTLSDIATVRIAPWMGPLGAFVVDAETASQMPDGDWVPAIDTDDIDPTTDQLSVPRRFALRTRADREPEGRIKDHLLGRRAFLPKRALKAKWWQPPETINYSLERPYLLVPRIARRLRVIDVPAGTVALNHNLALVTDEGCGRSMAEIRALLLSPESQAWIVRNAPRLEDGFYSITTKLLRRLPIPAAWAVSTPLALAA